MASAPMRYVKFGSTDMHVSEVCLGTMTFGSFCDEAETFEQLDAAVARGINFFDTAEMYPVPINPKHVNRTEVLMGKWLKARTSSGGLDRGKIFLASKVCGNARLFPEAAHGAMRAAVAGRADPVGDRPPAGHDAPGAPLPGLTAEQMMAACKASLQRLQCDYLDLYQLHWPQRCVPVFGKVQYRPENEWPEDNPPTPESFDRIVLGVKALLDAGLIKHWGLSNETAFGVMSICAAADRNGMPRPVSIQNDFSLLYRGFEQETAEACRHMGLVGLPYGALAGGTLSGKYNKDPKLEPPCKKARHVQFPNFQPRYHSEQALAATCEYTAVARKHGLTPATLALAWARSRWFNASVIIGTTSVANFNENVDAFQVELSQEILGEIDAIHKECRNPLIAE